MLCKYHNSRIPFMYKALLLTTSLLITLSACTQQENIDTFTCDSKLNATITNQDEESATLDYNKHQYQLIRQRSASGVKYTNENVLFWTKGKEAMLIIDGNKYHCNLQ